MGVLLSPSAGRNAAFGRSLGDFVVGICTLIRFSCEFFQATRDAWIHALQLCVLSRCLLVQQFFLNAV